MIVNRSIGIVAIEIAAVFSSAARAQDRAAPAPPAEAGRWGTLRGRVVFGGEPPVPVVLVDPAESWPQRDRRNQIIPGARPARHRDHDVIARRGLILSERLLVDRETKGVRNALVYLVKPTAVREAAREASPKTVRFRADACVFEPHVLAATEAAGIIVETVDPVGYNLHGRMPGAEFSVQGPVHFAESRDEFNFMFGRASPEKASGVQLLLRVRPGDADPIPSKFRDDLHPWMSAYWLILDHPYFAVTDDKGNFEIRDVPAGPQQVVVWHEALGAEVDPRPPAKPVFRGMVPIGRDGPTTKDFTIEPRLVVPGR